MMSKWELSKYLGDLLVYITIVKKERCESMSNIQ